MRTYLENIRKLFLVLSFFFFLILPVLYICDVFNIIAYCIAFNMFLKSSYYKSNVACG